MCMRGGCLLTPFTCAGEVVACSHHSHVQGRWLLAHTIHMCRGGGCLLTPFICACEVVTCCDDGQGWTMQRSQYSIMTFSMKGVFERCALFKSMEQGNAGCQTQNVWGCKKAPHESFNHGRAMNANSEKMIQPAQQLRVIASDVSLRITRSLSHLG
eukprot:354080-Chlamydomonas_euryale.AAC.4